MRLIWDLEDASCDWADDDTVRRAVSDAFDAVPKEHLRLLEAVTVFERDPRGRNLGVYLRDHRGNHIEVYLAPHCADAGKAPARVRLAVLRLHVAHTLFHEVGHHMTLTVNKRMAPSRRRGEVEQTMEKWAETYVVKRMQAYVAKQRTPDDDDPHAEAIAWLERTVTGQPARPATAPTT